MTAIKKPGTRPGKENAIARPTSEAPGPESNLSLYQPRNSRGCDKTTSGLLQPSNSSGCDKVSRGALSQPEEYYSCDKTSPIGDSLSLPRTVLGCDKNRIDALRFQLEQGVCLKPTTRAALDLALGFKVSLATAYRHLKRGTTPAEERRLGGDGKRRPAHPRGATVTRSHRLAMTIRRLARQIDPAELQAADYTTLSEAVDAIRKLWEVDR